MNNGSARIVIRGNNSVTGNNQPLFVVDGMPIDNSDGEMVIWIMETEQQILILMTLKISRF